MPIADAAYVIGLGRLQAVAPADVDACLAAAAIRLRRWVGAAAHDDAAAATPRDAQRAAALKLAEALLALSIAAPSLASTHSGQGYVGGASLTEGQASYLTPKQVEGVAAAYLAEAERLAGPYLLPAPAPGGIAVGAGHD